MFALSLTQAAERLKNAGQAAATGEGTRVVWTEDPVADIGDRAKFRFGFFKSPQVI